jgi:transposase
VLFRNWERLLHQRTELVNALRSVLNEYGHIIPKGIAHIKRIESGEVDTKLMAWHRADECSRRLAQIPGVGPIGASLLMMKTPTPEGFRSGRHFAAWIGLTPKDHSTAGKVRLGVITRAGDEALRSTLVVGATALLRRVRDGRGRNSSPWLLDLLKRKPPKLVAVALANKIARIAWKMMVTGEAYRTNAVPPGMACAL